MPDLSMLVPFDDALTSVLQLGWPLPAETVPIHDATGRSLTDTLFAQKTLPPYDNSAMDGYALRSADTIQSPSAFSVVDRIFAGQPPRGNVALGECVRIMTGAPLPSGADAVVKQERVKLSNDSSKLVVQTSLAPGENVRRKGEDTTPGQQLLAQGASLGIAEAALLWAQGITSVSVHRRPRVAIVSTGDELVPLGSPHESAIIDSNSPMLALAVMSAGGLPEILGIAKDEPHALENKLQRASDYDVVLVSAGVSVGEKDYTRHAMRSLGVSFHIQGVAMKPGKPVTVGQRDKTVFFGLPGNPLSAWVTFELFVRPVLKKMQGLTRVTPPMLPGKLAVPFSKKTGLTHFVPVTVDSLNHTLWATPLRSQSSGAHTASAGASCLMKLPAQFTAASKGQDVDLWPLQGFN